MSTIQTILSVPFGDIKILSECLSKVQYSSDGSISSDVEMDYRSIMSRHNDVFKDLSLPYSIATVTSDRAVHFIIMMIRALTDYLNSSKYQDIMTALGDVALRSGIKILNVADFKRALALLNSSSNLVGALPDYTDVMSFLDKFSDVQLIESSFGNSDLETSIDEGIKERARALAVLHPSFDITNWGGAKPMGSHSRVRSFVKYDNRGGVFQLFNNGAIYTQDFNVAGAPVVAGNDWLAVDQAIPDNRLVLSVHEENVLVNSLFLRVGFTYFFSGYVYSAVRFDHTDSAGIGYTGVAGVANLDDAVISMRVSNGLGSANAEVFKSRSITLGSLEVLANGAVRQHISFAVSPTYAVQGTDGFAQVSFFLSYDNYNLLDISMDTIFPTGNDFTSLNRNYSPLNASRADRVIPQMLPEELGKWLLNCDFSAITNFLGSFSKWYDYEGNKYINISQSLGNNSPNTSLISSFLLDVARTNSLQNVSFSEDRDDGDTYLSFENMLSLDIFNYPSVVTLSSQNIALLYALWYKWLNNLLTIATTNPRFCEYYYRDNNFGARLHS
jgi:hypothetical protein